MAQCRFRIYQCSCNKTFERTKWSDDPTIELCPCEKQEELDDISDRNVADTQVTSIIVGKHKKGRSPKEKTQRRVDDFKKNTMPTLPTWERKHFEKKHGK